MATKRKAAKGGLKAARTMPGKRSAGRRGPKLGARAAKRNASLQAMLQNEPVRTGVGSARAAYGRLSRRGKGAEDLVKDRKARRDLGRGAHSFGRAAAAVRGEKVRRRRRIGVRAVGFVVALGGAIAVAASEGLRQEALGLLSGASNGPEQ